ncbi:DNA (cytosine-5)-methyltransferase 1 [Methylobacillus rhizosphaerae]|uniref:DNA (cytosine-5-)-methyltransferase n=1 Tax=Methylobacillus rhizosphaerae TaxID=551994 RepID=A0A238YQY2_9PROT|nr:DNA cytosine methyltransferase [Methylobacillus rhizosphaerae]SNR73555.1 DNA (cytosine-5)-methyltransferase 1 [Methylobacillus rhizosphaerae]
MRTHHLQQNLDIHQKLIIDLFAGGGGFSEGVRLASGRNPDIAINHNDDALSMHRVNHPDTRHFIADVFEVDPRTVTQGRAVGHLHASPDCTHHSQAAGGQPRNEKRRALAWVVNRWAGQVKPDVISLENVVQMLQWGPLVAKRCKMTRRVVKLDGSVAEPGERVPREFQYLVPDPKQKGKTWRRFVSVLEGMGYEVKIEASKACVYGAGTTRERLYMIARCDGLPVEFPEATHFKKPAKGQKKWSAAHEHIDWSIPGKTIFDRKKPLAEATMRRIAKGIKRFVLDNPEPFIIQTSNTKANGSCIFDINEPLRTMTTRREFGVANPIMVQITQSNGGGVRSMEDPLPTITTAKGGEFTVVSPVMVQAGHGEGQPGKGQRWGSGTKSAEEPIGAITTSNGQALAAAYLARMKFDNVGADLADPLPTITAGGNSKRPAGAAHSLGLVAASMVTMRNNMDGADINKPVKTMTCGGGHHGLVECHLSKEDEARALRVSAFLMSYYGTDNISSLDEPAPTITTKDRLALVTVYYQGEPYVIVDITLRMLEPHELYSAQGFPKSYIITHGHDGRKFSKSAQVKMCGNSVSPLVAAALFRACHKHDDLLIRRVA